MPAHVYTHTHKHTHPHAHTHRHVNAHAHVHAPTHPHTHPPTHRRMNAHTHARTDTRTHARTHAQTVRQTDRQRQRHIQTHTHSGTHTRTQTHRHIFHTGTQCTDRIITPVLKLGTLHWRLPSRSNQNMQLAHFGGLVQGRPKTLRFAICCHNVSIFASVACPAQDPSFNPFRPHRCVSPKMQIYVQTCVSFIFMSRHRF
jgi:hypothetical protein